MCRLDIDFCPCTWRLSLDPQTAPCSEECIAQVLIKQTFRAWYKQQTPYVTYSDGNVISKGLVTCITLIHEPIKISFRILIGAISFYFSNSEDGGTRNGFQISIQRKTGFTFTLLHMQASPRFLLQWIIEVVHCSQNLSNFFSVWSTSGNASELYIQLILHCMESADDFIHALHVMKSVMNVNIHLYWYIM